MSSGKGGCRGTSTAGEAMWLPIVSFSNGHDVDGVAVQDWSAVGFSARGSSGVPRRSVQ
jgi:hypothetical protein